MKSIYNIFATLLIMFVVVACNENKWLEEVPLDFYSPENSYTEPEHFNTAVVRLYNRHRNLHFVGTGNMRVIGYLGDAMHYNGSRIIMFHNEMVPETGAVADWWEDLYRMIYDANVIINRIDDEEIVFNNEDERASLKAEAMFFRADAYRELTILYGGVPLILEELNTPKRDFVRASREQVLEQIVNDLTFASENLQDVSEVAQDGRLTKAVANHVLAEVYIIKKEWDKAIDASSEVINDPSYALMTERFGTRKDEPGDVFWDLFRRGNQNRNGEGGPNTEALWVSQYEHLIEGGGGRNFWIMTRMYGPRYYALEGKEDGKPLFFGYSSQHGGRSIGWTSTNLHADYEIWEESDWDDMRNSGHNILRDMVADNPESVYYGDSIVKMDAIKDPGQWRELWRPFWAKFVPFDNFPEETITNDPYPGATNKAAMGSFMDRYIYRLAETYLLRAEAYIGKGDLQSAAEDINVVRARAKATPVSPDEVNIDYLLDERTRELQFEEFRVLTLMRMNKLVERVEKYHMHFNGSYATNTLNPRVALWPIPQSEIERNTEAVLEQNPGYN